MNRGRCDGSGIIVITNDKDIMLFRDRKTKIYNDLGGENDVGDCEKNAKKEAYEESRMLFDFSKIQFDKDKDNDNDKLWVDLEIGDNRIYRCYIIVIPEIKELKDKFISNIRNTPKGIDHVFLESDKLKIFKLDLLKEYVDMYYSNNIKGDLIVNTEHNMEKIRGRTKRILKRLINNDNEKINLAMKYKITDYTIKEENGITTYIFEN